LVSDIIGGTLNEGVENMVLRGIFGSKVDEVSGGWRKLHNEELCDLLSLPSVIE
jgi:hypothetical protein